MRNVTTILGRAGRILEKRLGWIPFLRGPLRRRELDRNCRQYRQWQNEGAHLPMPHFGKKLALDEYIDRFRLPVMVETGTYRGQMVFSMLDRFEAIYSIELDDTFYRMAAKKFKPYRHVHLLHGESGTVLETLLPRIDSPCLFWLDAHYSGGKTARADLDTPIMKELEHVFNHPLADRHVVCIDDARCFNGTCDYPHIDALKSHIHQRRPDWVFEVRDDIIRTYSGKLPEKR